MTASVNTYEQDCRKLVLAWKETCQQQGDSIEVTSRGKNELKCGLRYILLTNFTYSPLDLYLN